MRIPLPGLTLKTAQPPPLFPSCDSWMSVPEGTLEATCQRCQRLHKPGWPHGAEASLPHPTFLLLLDFTSARNKLLFSWTIESLGLICLAAVSSGFVCSLKHQWCNSADNGPCLTCDTIQASGNNSFEKFHLPRNCNVDSHTGKKPQQSAGWGA